MILRAAFTAYPDGIEVRAETEYLNAEDYSAASRKTTWSCPLAIASLCATRLAA